MPDTESESLQRKHLTIFLHEVSKRLSPAKIKGMSMRLSLGNDRSSENNNHGSEEYDSLNSMISQAIIDAQQAYPVPQVLNPKSFRGSIKNHIESILSHYGLRSATISRNISHVLERLFASYDTKDEAKKKEELFRKFCIEGKDAHYYIDFIGHLEDYFYIVNIPKECYKVIVNAFEEIGGEGFLRIYPERDLNLIALIIDSLNNNVNLPPKLFSEAIKIFSSRHEIGPAITNIVGVRGGDSQNEVVKRQKDILLTTYAKHGPAALSEIIFAISGVFPQELNSYYERIQSGYLIDSETGIPYNHK